MKPKEWLYKHGHITTIGRGRLSGEHIALIKDAVKNGAMIEGYSVESTPNSTVKTVIKSDKPTGETAIADVGEPLRDERTLSAVAGGKTVGMRTVCNVCRNSLTYCFCPQPRVWVDYNREAVVEFVARKHPPK